MRTAWIAFAAGAWTLQRQTSLPEADVVASLLVASVASLAVGALAPARRTLRLIAVAIAAGTLGFAWAAWRADSRMTDTLPPDVEGRDVVVVGTVASLPGVADRAVRFAFTVESVKTRDERGRPLVVPSSLSLAWYAPRGAASASSLPDLRPGQRWRLVVRLKRPHGAANPWGFDYEYWLLEEGLRATGYVRADAAPPPDEWSDDDTLDGRTTVANRKLDEFVFTPGHAIERLRAVLRDRILRDLAGDRPLAEAAPYAGVLVALVVGDQRAIAESDWTTFSRTGIGHLVSISGLHVSMLAALGAWLVFEGWRRMPALAGRLAAQRAAALAGTAVALLYCLLAGWGVPAQRTLYMIATVAFALWTRRATSPSRVLAIALAVVVALDPWAVLDAGPWLSFAAVAAIFYATSGRIAIREGGRWDRAKASLASAARIQWAVTLALVPLTVLFFGQVSLVSPIANAIAIPLVSFVVTPLALAGAVVPGIVGTLLLQLAHACMGVLARWLEWLSATPLAVWTGGAPPAWAVVVATIGVAWWLAPRGLPSRWAGALWLAPLFAWPVERPPTGAARLTAIDIGQGTAVLVETRATTLLYDTGPQYAPGSDAGSRTIVPLLRARGIDRIDTLVVSHNDIDHSGGALSILARVRVDETLSSLAPTSPIVRASRAHRACRDGDTWTVDGVRFAFLHPDAAIYREEERGAPPTKPNARSCVLRIEAAGRVALLTGDVEAREEARLVARDASSPLAADVLVVPHHGSRTSSTAPFLDAVRPRLAIVQAGYRNRFGHPRPDVLARYAERGIAVARNDRDGAITVTLGTAGAGDIAVERFRVAHHRYWMEPLATIAAEPLPFERTPP